MWENDTRAGIFTATAYPDYKTMKGGPNGNAQRRLEFYSAVVATRILLGHGGKSVVLCYKDVEDNLTKPWRTVSCTYPWWTLWCAWTLRCTVEPGRGRHYVVHAQRNFNGHCDVYNRGGRYGAQARWMASF